MLIYLFLRAIGLIKHYVDFIISNETPHKTFIEI